MNRKAMSMSLEIIISLVVGLAVVTMLIIAFQENTSDISSLVPEVELPELI